MLETIPPSSFDKVVLEIAERILHLSLRPSVSRGAVHRLDAVMPAQLKEQGVPAEVGQAAFINHSAVVVHCQKFRTAAEKPQPVLQRFENRCLGLIHAGSKVLTATVAQRQ